MSPFDVMLGSKNEKKSSESVFTFFWLKEKKLFEKNVYTTPGGTH